MSTKRFALWGFKSPREWVGTALGTLERQVLELAWTQPELSVRLARDQLGGHVAYTTLMTTLDRLFRKGLLTRRKAGRAFVYAAALSREELEGAVASGLVSGLFAGGASGALPLLSSLVDAVSDRDRCLLDELERLVAQKRAALDGEDPS